MSGLRLRVGVFAGVVLLAVAGVVVYLRQAVTADPDGHTPAAASVDTGVAPVVAGAHVVFRSTAPGDGYGRVAVVPVDAPSGPARSHRRPASGSTPYAAPPSAWWPCGDWPPRTG